MANTSAPIKGAMIEEPPAAGNRRHPSDLLRLIIALLATILGFVLATMLNEISEAITVEVIEVFDAVPSAVMVVLLLLLSIIGFILPFVVIWFFVKHKRWRSLGLAAVAVAGSLLLLWVVDTYLVSKFSAPDLPFTRPRWICAPGADPATLGPLECANVPSLSNPIERYGYLVAFTAFFSAVIPHLTRRWKRFGWITIVTFAVTRMLSFLDAPVDEFLAIGIAYSMGVGVLLVFGDTDRRPRGADIAAGLQRAGITLSALKRANVDARGSVPYFATQQNGRGLFVKVLTLDERAADIMFRVLRMFRLKGVGDERPFSSLKRAVEHEAVVSLMASKDGVETPQLQAVADIPPSSMVMAYDAIDGRSLDSVPAEMMTDQLVQQIWTQVEILREHRTAHRDLRLANVFLSSDDQLSLIDFGFSELAATEGQMRSDIAELIASTATVVGAERAVSNAVAVVGPDAVAEASARVQPLALSGATRDAIKHQKGLDGEVRDEIARQTGVDEVPLENLERIKPKVVLMIVGFGFAMYFLIPQLAQTNFGAVLDANWAWAPAILVASFFTYVGAAFNLMGSIVEKVRLVPTVFAQFAGSFINRITPVKVGGMATNVRYFQKNGVDLTSAVAGIGVSSVATFAIHMSLLLITVVTLGRNAGDFIKLPSGNTILLGLVALFTVSGLLVFLPFSRKIFKTKVWPAIKSSGQGLAAVATSPVKALMLFGGAFLMIVAYITALWFSLEAFGGGLSIAGVALTFLGGQALGNLAPTPGGIGATEAAMIAAMTALGLDATTAVSATFLYRIATFWLPILPGIYALRKLERDGML